MKILETVEKVLVENFLPAQIVNILRAELHILHVLNNLFKSSKNREAARVGIAPIKYVKSYASILAAVDEIAVRHCHLVEIHHHRQISFIKLRHL